MKPTKQPAPPMEPYDFGKRQIEALNAELAILTAAHARACRQRDNAVRAARKWKERSQTK